MDNLVLKTIHERRTIRFYKDEQITDEQLSAILEAAVWAPSGRNGQPCHIRVLQDKKALEALNVDFKNKVGWDTPAYTNWNISPVYQNAPTLIFLFAEGNSAMDGGIMTENICIAAKSMGLGTCIIASVGGLMNEPEGNVWKKRMNIPEDYRFLIAVAVGYPDEDPAPKPRAEGRVEIFKELALSE